MKINNVLFFALLALAGNAIAMQNDDLGKQLLEAARDGKPEIVMDLLDHGVLVDYAARDGWTPLMWAAWKGHTKVAELLLDRGASVHKVDKDGWTSLMHARKFEDIVRMILDKGANINHASKNGNTILLYAVESVDLRFVRFLLDKGADVYHMNKCEQTALLKAAECGNRECCEMIINHLIKDEKQQRFYTFLLCLKQFGLYRDVFNLLKAAAQKARVEEREFALREINKIPNEYFRQVLLIKYFSTEKAAIGVPHE